MRSFIRCLKLLKYGSCVRKQLTFMLVIAVIGMILEFRSINSFIGGFYIFLFPITIGHMFISLSMSVISFKEKTAGIISLCCIFSTDVIVTACCDRSSCMACS